mmetsp:Transcript_67246/g.194459  ORF Transcript_67246/g.194459 Transcript_67246/m.194459 type:complete len:305 (+) Transcript_67246:97-1011(+)
MMHPGMPMQMGQQQRVGGQPMYMGGGVQGQPYPYGGQTMMPQAQQTLPSGMPQAAPRPMVQQAPMGSSAAMPTMPQSQGAPQQQQQQGAPPSMPSVSGAVPPPMMPTMSAKAAPPQLGAPMTTLPQGAAPVTTVRPSMSGSVGMTREQALDKQVAELRAQIAQRDDHIKDLQQKLRRYEGKGSYGSGVASKAKADARKPTVSAFRKLTGATPMTQYQAIDQNDPVDVRLEEFYNSTGSAIPFYRINRGFYRFGDTIAELDIINHKLMARTEDGWNRGKFGPIEKFVGYYENIEREKAGLEVDMA